MWKNNLCINYNNKLINSQCVRNLKHCQPLQPSPPKKRPEDFKNIVKKSNIKYNRIYINKITGIKNIVRKTTYAVTAIIKDVL